MASWELYDLLIEKARCEGTLTDILLGINWSVAKVDIATPQEDDRQKAGQYGLCFSPTQIPRTIPWAGTLLGRSTNELTPWITQWHPAAAVVGVMVINAVINSSSNLLSRSQVIESECPAHLRVFQYFSEQMTDKNVVVVGHYPNLEANPAARSWHCLERNLRPGDTPDTAAEFVIPEADWVFITASSLANKTLPRLLELAKGAQVVLMGPSLPWLEEWADFGVNYLAGVEICCGEKLWQVSAQAGGTRIFDEGCRYRVAKL